MQSDPPDLEPQAFKLSHLRFSDMLADFVLLLLLLLNVELALGWGHDGAHDMYMCFDPFA